MFPIHYAQLLRSDQLGSTTCVLMYLQSSIRKLMELP